MNKNNDDDDITLDDITFLDDDDYNELDDDLFTLTITDKESGEIIYSDTLDDD